MEANITLQPRRHTAWRKRVPRQYIDFMPMRWPMWLSHFAKAAPPLPSQCCVCHAWPSKDVLCCDCAKRFAHRPLRCMGCALALPGLSPQHPYCGACLQRPPVWQHAYAWIDYGYPWNHLITRWKFVQQPALAAHFARWMRQDPQVCEMLDSADLVIPIPLTKERMRERGYNPAAQLARALSPGKCALHTLQRIRHTEAQSHLTRAQRLRNLRGAFVVALAQRASLSGQHVILIDDVMTTGATLTTASRALRQGGAAQISVLCLARTP